MKSRRLRSAFVGLLVILCRPRAAPAQELDRSRRPVAPPPKEFVFPPVNERTLRNGLHVQVVENHELPIVAVRVVLAADSTYDPPGKEGLAAVTMAMLREATSTASADRLSDIMGALGTTISPGGFTTSTSHFHRALDVLADMLRHPAFPDSAFHRVVATRALAARQLEAVPFYQARSLFYRILYGGAHPFYRVPTDTSISAITLDDVKAFYSTYVRPENATIIVVGDVRARELVPTLDAAFGSWPAGGLRASPHTEPVATLARTAIYLRDAPGAPQSTIFVGQMGPTRDTPDYFALETANTVLGAVSGSRLFQSLREKHGFAYTVVENSLWRRAPEPSTIRGSANVAAAKTDSAVVEWLEELGAIRGARPVTREEFERARMAQIGSLPIRLETVDEVANALAQLATIGEGADYYARLQRAVSAEVPEDVTRAAHRYLDPDHLVIVIVGDRKVIEPGLRAANIAPVIVVDAAGRNVDDTPIRKSSSDASAKHSQ